MYTKTLIVRLSSMGDVLLTSPLIRAMRQKFPGMIMDLVVKEEFAPLVRHNRNLNRVIEFDPDDGIFGLLALRSHIRSQGYSLLIDLHDSLRSKVLRAGFRGETRVVNKRLKERKALIRKKENLYGVVVPVADRYIETVADLGIANDGKGLELTIPTEINERMDERFAKFVSPAGTYIGMAPSAHHNTKRWQEEKFTELAIKLSVQFDSVILLFGGVGDEALCKRIEEKINFRRGQGKAFSFAGQLSLLESAAVIRHTDCFISNDTGLMHMAAAVDRPIVAIFGPTVKEFGFFPSVPRAAVVEHPNLACRPCTHIGTEKCPEGHFKCMAEITTEEVYSAVVKKMWEVRK